MDIKLIGKLQDKGQAYNLLRKKFHLSSIGKFSFRVWGKEKKIKEFLQEKKIRYKEQGQ